MPLIYSKLPVGPDHYLDGQNKDQGDIITPVTVKGGIYNGDFEIGSGSVSASGYPGGPQYGWYAYYAGTGAGTAGYDTTQKNMGLQSM